MELKEREKIRYLAEAIQKSKNVVFLTGAGISVPSGIPDFRSPNGLYAKYGQEIFDIEHFHAFPDKFYAFAKEGLITMLDCQPNPVHKLIAELEERGYVKGVITQNIDGLHQKAGSRKVAELHGNARMWHCLKCSKRFDITDNTQREELLKNNFRCSCGGLTKPDIVFFGEILPIDEWAKAEKWATTCDVFVTVGTSLFVYPASTLPLIAYEKGAFVAIINKGPTGLDKLAQYPNLKIEIDVLEFARLFKDSMNVQRL